MSQCIVEILTSCSATSPFLQLPLSSLHYALPLPSLPSHLDEACRLSLFRDLDSVPSCLTEHPVRVQEYMSYELFKAIFWTCIRCLKDAMLYKWGNIWGEPERAPHLRWVRRRCLYIWSEKLANETAAQRQASCRLQQMSDYQERPALHFADDHLPNVVYMLVKYRTQYWPGQVWGNYWVIIATHHSSLTLCYSVTIPHASCHRAHSHAYDC